MIPQPRHSPPGRHAAGRQPRIFNELRLIAFLRRRFRESSATYQKRARIHEIASGGQFIGGWATRKVDRFGVGVEDEMLVVDTTKFHQFDRNSTGWADANVPL